MIRFETIVETKKPKVIQGIKIGVEEATKILMAYKNLSEENRNKFVTLSIEKMLEFSSGLTGNTNSLSIKKYIKETEEKIIEKSNVVVAEQQSSPKPPQFVDNPDLFDTLLEETKKKIPSVIMEIICEAQEKFFENLLNQQLESVKNSAILLESSNTSIGKYLDKLTEFDSNILMTLKGITEYIDTNNSKINEQITELSKTPKEVTDFHKYILVNQKSIIENQSLMVKAINELTEKVAAITTTIPQPIVIPAPIVTVNENNNNRDRVVTKMVERNEKGQITKVIEKSDSDDI